jgi:hypothetical protein
MLCLTIPPFGGVNKLLVKSLIGRDDIAALFARGRVEATGQRRLDPRVFTVAPGRWKLGGVWRLYS